MGREINVVLIDGYIDDPAALGVPPYISPMVRAVAGAAADAGGRVEYITADMLRSGAEVPEADVSAVLSGNTVPGRYLRSMPLSTREVGELLPRLSGWRILGGSAAKAPVAGGFDHSTEGDLAAALHDHMTGREAGGRWRDLDEWNRWMLLGADIVTRHQDFPHPLTVEIETYRGCHRHADGGCSYCIEPLKGRPLVREPEDVLEEAALLRGLGVRNIRVGGQTCIVSYGTRDRSGTPRPEPETVSRLFGGLRDLGFGTLHVDNANPAVIAAHPDESRAVLETLTACCTSGNVLALGMESADPAVIAANNLNATPDQVLTAVRMINGVGGARGATGLPRLLPGLNIICGLDGETAATYGLNLDFLRGIRDEGISLRRINIRQVLPVRRDFRVKVDRRRFRRFKEQVREEIDRVMLQRIAPAGTVLRDVRTELRDGRVTFGRQTGSYPLLVGIPYPLDLDTEHDVCVTGWGYRSLTGVTFPFDINNLPMSALEALPGIGRRRAAALVRGRPFNSMPELEASLDDPSVAAGLADLVVFR